MLLKTNGAFPIRLERQEKKTEIGIIVVFMASGDSKARFDLVSPSPITYFVNSNNRFIFK